MKQRKTQKQPNYTDKNDFYVNAYKDHELLLLKLFENGDFEEIKRLQDQENLKNDLLSSKSISVFSEEEEIFLSSGSTNLCDNEGFLS